MVFYFIRSVLYFLVTATLFINSCSAYETNKGVYASKSWQAAKQEKGHVEAQTTNDGGLFADQQLTKRGPQTPAIEANPVPIPGADIMEIRTLLDRIAPHPRLIYTSADEIRINALVASNDDILKRTIELNRRNADLILGMKASSFNSGMNLSKAKEIFRRVLCLAMAYRNTGAPKYARRAAHEMLAVAAFPNWNPSHYLDVAQTAAALAIGYDWIHDTLSQSEKQAIVNGLINNAIQPAIACIEDQSISGCWWVKKKNNWGQVTRSSFIIAALAIADHDKDLAASMIEKAYTLLPVANSRYGPDGASEEGPNYWDYGMIYSLMAIFSLKTSIGTDLGLSQAPGYDNAPYYIMHSLAPSGRWFNYGDVAEAWTKRISPSVAGLAGLYPNDQWTAWNNARLDLAAPAGTPGRPRFHRYYPLQIAWYQAAPAGVSLNQIPLEAKFQGKQDVAMIRGSWTDSNAFYLGLKGGHNQASHGHIDIGTFVMETNGVRWALDLGPEDYNVPGYWNEAQRNTYYRVNNFGHNTLVINDKLQNFTAEADIIAFQQLTDRIIVKIDMSQAYAGETDSAARTFTVLNRRSVIIKDELEGLDGKVRWGMITGASISLQGSSAILKQKGKSLSARIISPADATFTIFSTSPPTDKESKNNGTKMLGITVYHSNPNMPLTIEIALEPQ